MPWRGETEARLPPRHQGRRVHGRHRSRAEHRAGEKRGESPVPFRERRGRGLGGATAKSKLDGDEIVVLQRWIDEGASWPDGADLAKLEDKTDWWSFKPLRAERRHRRGPLTPSSARKLEENGLAPSPQADARTLIRRLSFDLTGLPPTPEEVEAFVDGRGSARLREAGRPPARLAALRRTLGAALARRRPLRRDARLRQGQAAPQRLAVSRLRHPRVQRRQALRAVRAGADRRRRAVSRTRATASRRSASSPPGRGISSATSRCRRRRSTARSRGISTATTWWRTRCGTFASLTVHCAQCHNHKFDPISQEDYYTPAGGLRGARSHRVGCTTVDDVRREVRGRCRNSGRLAHRRDRGDRKTPLKTEKAGQA